MTMCMAGPSMRWSFARSLIAIIALLCAALDLSAQEPAPTLQSAVQGCRVMDLVFAADR